MTHIFATAAAPALRRAGVRLTRTGTPNPTGAPVLRGSLEEGTFEGRFWRPYQRGETDKLYDRALQLARASRLHRRDREADDDNRHAGGSRNDAIPALSQSATLIFKLLCDLGRLCRGEIYPTYEWLAEKSGLARATVARALSQLRSIGFVTAQRRCKRIKRQGPGPRFEQTSNAYRLEWPPRLGRWLGQTSAPCPLPDDEMVRLANIADEREAMRSTERKDGPSLRDVLDRIEAGIERESQKEPQPLQTESYSPNLKKNWPRRPIAPS